MRCSDCNALLVPALQNLPTASTRPEGAVLAWLGADPASFSRVQAALAEAGIETYEADEHYHMTWEPRMRYRRYAIFVHGKDATGAAEAIRQTGVPPE